MTQRLTIAVYDAVDELAPAIVDLEQCGVRARQVRCITSAPDGTWIAAPFGHVGDPLAQSGGERETPFLNVRLSDWLDREIEAHLAAGRSLLVVSPADPEQSRCATLRLLRGRSRIVYTHDIVWPPIGRPE